MALKVGIVEGWSAPLDFQLLNDGVPQNLTAMTVTGQARNRYRAFVDLASDVSVTTATDGLVRLIPDTDDFMEANGPYELRFKVVDSATQCAYFPSEEAITLIVRP
jgi:hypothetical protein